MTVTQRAFWFVVLLMSGLWTETGTVHAAEHLVVIVSSQDPVAQLDNPTLHDIYLKKIFLDSRDRRLIPVNLPPDHRLRQLFARHVLHQTDASLQDYWNQRYYHGIRPPYVLGSQAAVVQFVASTPGAIGYVLPCYLQPDVTPLMELPLSDAEAASLSGLCPE